MVAADELLLAHRTWASSRTTEDADDVGDDDVVDHADFKISQDGVLTFASKPNFEEPEGRY